MAFIDSIVTDGVRTTEAGRLVATVKDSPYAGSVKATDFAGRLTYAAIERNGAERAVVMLKGVHRAADGREWLPWTMRLSFFGSSPDISLTHSFIFDGDQEKDFISALGVAFDVPMREAAYNRHVAFSTSGGGVWSEPVQPLVGRRVIMNPATGNRTIRSGIADERGTHRRLR